MKKIKFNKETGNFLLETSKGYKTLTRLHENVEYTDYLNWYEATQMEATGTPLLDSLSTPDIPKRTDPITLHLDSIEARGWK